MQILYLCSDPGVNIAGTSGAAVHVRELCDAFGRLGHNVSLVCAEANGNPRIPHVTIVQVVGPAMYAPAALISPLWAARTVGGEWARSSVGASGPTKGQHTGIVRRRLGAWRTALDRHVRSRRFARAAVELAKRNPPAFIYERYSPYGCPGITVATAHRAPFIVEVNFAFSLEARYDTVKQLAAAQEAERKRLRRISRAATLITVPAEHVKSLLVQQFNVSEGRIHVVENGVDVVKFDPLLYNGASVRSRYGLENKLVVGFMGSMKPWHDLDTLLESARSISPGANRLHYLLVGDGPMLDKVRQQVQADRLNHSVTFTGAVSHEDMPNYIAAMDIAVCLLKGRPPSSVKRYEYMAMGRSIIASGRGEPPGALVHGQNAILVPQGDHRALSKAILDLAGDPPLRTRLGTTARRCAEDLHTWESRAEGILRILDARNRRSDLLGNHRVRRSPAPPSAPHGLLK